MAQTRKPNILIIWGDDICWYNISTYYHGVMGYRAPNIDRLAREGRVALITGQSPIRTGLTEVGLPGSPPGLRPEDPTIAEFLPTARSFDEFFGNLYHLNAEQKPECEDYPKNPEFKKKFGPRGMLHHIANPDGTQKIEDTGPLNVKPMETIDEEIRDLSLQPFFCWFNSTRMHVFTHLKKESQGVSGLGVYPDGMVEHDGHVGILLKKLDDLGIADNTIVVYSTDNGAEELSWPDGGATPFRGEKDTNWDGGWRVPCMIRWPGVIKPGTVSNDIASHQDMLPTLVTAAGEPDIAAKLKQGYTAGKKTFKVYIDGFNLLPYWKGDVKQSPRPGFFHWSDDGDLIALSYGNWKVHFPIRRAEGFDARQEQFDPPRMPMLMNLRSDPFENARVSADVC